MLLSDVLQLEHVHTVYWHKCDNLSIFAVALVDTMNVCHKLVDDDDNHDESAIEMFDNTVDIGPSLRRK